MLTNLDLEQICSENGFNLIGVFSKNKLPYERRVGSYVINLQDDEDGDGTHWVSCIIFPNKKCCYFDAFGMPMPIDVSDFLKPFKPVAQNNREIQDTKSDKCGYFCLSFIKYFKNFNYKKKDIFDAYDDFLNCYSNNTKLNDKIVMELLDKY